MDEEEGEGERWTCDACGCNTNPASSSVCGICGTSVSLLRRAAGRAWFSGRLPDELEASLAAEASSSHQQQNIPNHERLLQDATQQQDYHPYWRQSSDLEVASGSDTRHLCHVPFESLEGRPIRAIQSIPDVNGTYGFKVVFDKVSATSDASSSSRSNHLGGSYLVGLVPNTFSDYNSFKGLQNSERFWGLEDSGTLYEGGLRGRKRECSFGNHTVLTLLVHQRSLSVWKNGSFCGTILHNLPESYAAYYPVAVPVHRGTTVAITGLGHDPLTLLQTYTPAWHDRQRQRLQELRQRIQERQAALVVKADSNPDTPPVVSPPLQTALNDILAMYHDHPERLWYRCGWKVARYPGSLDTFLDVLQAIVVDEEHEPTCSPSSFVEPFVIGDTVQLVQGYEQFSDASGGPLQWNDRGKVVDLQKGPHGEQRSIRVLYNGRRWWYQQQAIQSVRSGLIDGSIVWMLTSLLNQHGYGDDAQKRVNVEVTRSNWKIGDIVTPVSCLNVSNVYGRIVSGTRTSDLITVEYVDEEFATAVGARRPTETNKLESSRVNLNQLRFSAIPLESQDCKEEAIPVADETMGVSEKTKADVAAVANLETSALDSLVKECSKSSDALATLFAAGLPDRLLEAVEMAKVQMNRLEPPEDLSQKLTSVGNLVSCIAEQLFGDATHKPVAVAAAAPSNPNPRGSSQPAPEPSARGGAAAIRRRMNYRRAQADRRDRRSHLELLRPAPPNPSSQQQQDEEGGMDMDSQRFVNSLQHRRSMLLSLMSRRRGGSASAAGAFLSSMAGEDLSALGSLRGVPPYVFGPDIVDDEQNNNNWDTEPRPSELERAQNSNQPQSFLDDLLRCRGDVMATGQASVRQGGAAFSTFVRLLVNYGIVVDSVKWAEALVHAHHKKVQIDKFSILRNAVDEEGTPVLRLAISFGCCFAMIHKLIGWGAPVTKQEIQLAARTNQPRVLSLLLQHASLSEMDVNAETCTHEIRNVLEKTKSRQSALEHKMRDAASDFVVRLMRELWKLGLSSRRTFTARTQACSKVVCEMLVGSVLLLAVQQNQKSSPSLPLLHRETSDRSGGGLSTTDESDSGLELVSKGLFRLVPRDIVCDCLTGEGHLTSFLLLCEDYLCSKDMNDIAAGLTLLSTALSYFPQLRKSPELERFGMLKFVSNHNTRASDRVTEILSKQLVDLDMEDSEEKGSAAASAKERGVVKCPKNHVAELHITRHSSFRCDICGSGVDRGRLMHGCRQCDWDACEECTDKSESGLVKYTALRELAGDCLKLLSDASSPEAPDERVAELLNIVSNDAVPELKEIAKRLFRRDVRALNDLGLLLNEPGRVSVQQFMQHVLPPLHASLVHQSAPSDGAGSGHRKKKARVTDDDNEYASDSFDSRLDFCHAALLQMMPVMDSKVSAFPSFESGAASKKSGYESSRPPSPPVSEGKIADISYSANASEILRRLHQVLSFYENVTVTSSLPAKKSNSSGPPKSDLHSLTKPIEIHFLPASIAEGANVGPKFRSVVQSEPLVPFEDLRQHVLRTYRVSDPQYIDFCRRLSSDHAVIMERAMKDESSPWKIARIESFDEATGAHQIRYASSWKRGQNRDVLNLGAGSGRDLSLFRFSGPESCLILAARKFYVLFRTPRKDTSSHQASASRDVAMLPSSESDSNKILQAIGSRVESSCGGDWRVYTMVAVDTSCGPDDYSFDLVSEEGELYRNVLSDNIRAQITLSEEDQRRRRPSRSSRDDRASGLFPFFAVARARSEFMREESSDSFSGPSRGKAVLKRSWSALSLIDNMRPVDLSIPSAVNDQSPVVGASRVSFNCSLDMERFDLVAETSWLEVPPYLSVKFGVHESIAGMQLPSPCERTVVSVLSQLHMGQVKRQACPPGSNCLLYFSVEVDSSERPKDELIRGRLPSTEQVTVDTSASLDYALAQRSDNRTRKLSARSLGSEGSDDTEPVGLCEGLDQVCVQCMEVIGVFSQCADDDSAHKVADSPDLPGFANPVLSKKLTAQLDDPVSVVGGALPDWCRFGPSFCPKVFSYESRRSLLERAAFGVSRSTLKQQEAHVNVGKLRTRMSALRSRAVELVGEAFSGGAEDPTALQLQADELYGMEEALASKVRSAFRAVKWQEHSLQVAKAAVRRDKLLEDAAAVMHKYATDKRVCRRRLEVRFDGESGFDAASGDEAGVTRGFYADVAEALLSVDRVAGVYSSSPCSKMAAAASLENVQPMDTDELEKEAAKLPLWIPDLDHSGQVVIPTPRADKRSAVGVFPRPLPRYHPQYDEVCQQFRFMGRLFAAAMRDGFMFPLPLSSAFLKLVQMCGIEQHDDRDGFVEPHACTLLQSSDLPRPGFLGGEVYAADQFVCRALDELDASSPSFSRHELKRRYEDIATDTNFARSALGKNYECSFEEYFQDRAFVDPLDPTQSDGAPLCPNGCKKPVTVFNVREWVVLAKNFILHDGVLGQAKAFRQGVEDFFSVDYSLHLFAPEELQRDVCGIGDDVDKWNEAKVRKLFKLDGGKGAAEALVAVAAIGGEGGAALSRRFGPSSPTIGFLVKALLEGTPKQRRQFLSFVTSVPIVTPGRIEVVPILSPSGEFLPMQDPGCLPRANTCARRLYLPKFESFESFSTVLWAVVKAESSFKGFYEWRGSH